MYYIQSSVWVLCVARSDWMDDARVSECVTGQTLHAFSLTVSEDKNKQSEEGECLMNVLYKRRI